MNLKIHNSLSGEKELFNPIEPGKVKMYVCGMTVYDYCHIGHARVLVGFDMIVRYLRHLGYEVTYVRNITDVDDKIFNRANENNEHFSELTARFIEAMHEDERALNVLKPDIEPRATDYIQHIIDLVKKLIENGHAYAADNGDVYFSVKSYEDYGKLSKRQVDELMSGARVEIEQGKDDPLDFALWKTAKPDEESWSSPWGDGRPGWHIECSAMSMDCLGKTFDIHGGGPDLKFPHHENEIAQSECANCQTYVNYWMHAGAVRVNKEKMSKSLGNFFTIREVLEQYDAEVVRYFILSSHYRSQIDYSETNLKEAKSALDRLYQSLRDVPQTSGQVLQEVQTAFEAAMSDDFGTPEALSVLFDTVRQLNKAKSAEPEKVADLVTTLKYLGGLLGLLEQDPTEYFTALDQNGLTVSEIEQFIAQRKQARDQKDWAESDRIRDLLFEQGIVLDDGSQGTSWRRA